VSEGCEPSDTYSDAWAGRPVDQPCGRHYGIDIVASLVLLADRRAGRRSGWLRWTALASGTAGSLAANVATAHPDPVSRIIAGRPTVVSHMKPARQPVGRRRSGQDCFSYSFGYTHQGGGSDDSRRS
jgi:hypothetical protein